MVSLRRSLLGCCVLLALSCRASDPASESSAIYRGHYRWFREIYEFTPCGSKERWSISGEGDVHPLLQGVTTPQGLVGGTVAYAEVRGRVTRKGRWGHLGQYRHEIIIERVLHTSRQAPPDCQ